MKTKDHPIVGAVITYMEKNRRGMTQRAYAHVTAVYTYKGKLIDVEANTTGIRNGNPWSLTPGSWARTLAFLQGPRKEIPKDCILYVTPGPNEAEIFSHDYWEWCNAREVAS